MKGRGLALPAGALLAGVLLSGGAMCIGGACSRDDAARLKRQERRQFSIVMESKMRQLDRGIASLGDTPTLTDSVFASEVEDLKRNQQALRSRLAAMSAVPEREWPALRDSVETDYHHVREQYGALVHHETLAEPAPADSSMGDAPSLPR
ncbi:MAG TPA: hypothetical protein VEC56_02000 [Candidatus Krumholzibacteria bacterium]|nr:hypothetical protein [Candidatus Krumholzibacteria bacterium]